MDYKKEESGSMEFQHKSVLLEECIHYLDIKPNGVYVDGTLGGGGHSYEICKRLSEKGRLVGIDQDGDAIRAASERLSVFGDKRTLLRRNYSKMREALAGLGICKVDGILLDLGVSSYQLDKPERGFTYRMDAPLDMRMDGRQEFTAKDLVNTYPEEELYRVIRDYGEEKFARNIARRIREARERKEIGTTGELVRVIQEAIPAKAQINRGHPAKRTFQAIRIELNQELDVLEGSLEDMIRLLHPGGRICVITFHSLEDRIVKNIFRKSEKPCTCPSNFPVCVCGKEPLGRAVSKKPILPSEEEMASNPRAKSAKLRVFERR